VKAAGAGELDVPGNEPYIRAPMHQIATISNRRRRPFRAVLAFDRI
jgi:hypothetical protein